MAPNNHHRPYHCDCGAVLMTSFPHRIQSHKNGKRHLEWVQSLSKHREDSLNPSGGTQNPLRNDDDIIEDNVSEGSTLLRISQKVTDMSVRLERVDSNQLEHIAALAQSLSEKVYGEDRTTVQLILRLCDLCRPTYHDIAAVLNECRQ